MNSLLTEPEISPALKVAINIDKQRMSAINQLKSAADSCFQEFWFPANGLTCQDIADAFGTSCSRVFSEHAAAIEFLLSQGVELDLSKHTPPHPFTVNEDGSVTISIS
jgi:hypothetical protein